MKTKTVLIRCEVPEDFNPEIHYPEVEIRVHPSAEVFEDPVTGDVIEHPTDKEIKAHFMAYSDKALDVIDWYKKRIGL